MASNYSRFINSIYHNKGFSKQTIPLPGIEEGIHSNIREQQKKHNEN